MKRVLVFIILLIIFESVIIASPWSYRPRPKRPRFDKLHEYFENLKRSNEEQIPVSMLIKKIDPTIPEKIRHFEIKLLDSSSYMFHVYEKYDEYSGIHQEYGFRLTWKIGAKR